jgi:succinate dehydrogenase / fumarate reductase flavoprotein subunit
MAAAMGNVDDRDSWKVHFADTMRGGQYVNNWRMAELHAKEAPARVHELEAWGAVFDRTKEGKISQRNFGGHRYPRLAHVGDRTGLELIRTLQDHGIHQGITVHMEYTIVSLLKDGDRVVGAFGYDRERGRFRFSRPRPSSSHRRTGPRLRSRAIPGKAPATAFRSRITRARNCSTWNSSSFIRPA